MKIRNVVFGCLSAILCFMLIGCSANRKTYRTNNLLVKNNVSIINQEHLENEDEAVSSSDLSSYVVPITNTKFLGMIRLKLYAYELGYKIKKNSGFKRWLQSSVGEPPVYADTAFFDKTIAQFNQELFNLGFFNPEISYTTHTNRKHKTKITYLVDPKEPYRYDNVYNTVSDTAIQQIVFGGRSSSLIKEGNILNLYTLDEERNRITSLLRNQGYYMFSKDLIEYSVDTNLMAKKANLHIDIKKPVIQEKGANKEIDLHKYYIRNVKVYSNFDPSLNYNRTYENDITVTQHIPENKATDGTIFFYDIGKQKLRHDVLMSSIYITPGQQYSHDAVSMSNKSLTNIPSIRYAAIAFEPVGSFNDSLLDCSVRITRKKLHAFSINTEVTNNSGRLGMGLNLNYNNRNIFKAGESLQLTTSGAIELQFGKNDTDAGNLIYTAQAGVTATLFFPRILLPFGWGRMPGYYSPKTNVEVGYAYQKRAQLYDRIISNISMGYSWMYNRKISNYFSPIDFNFVNIDKEPILEQYISQMKGSLYERQYTSHTLLGMRYTFVYSSQSKKIKRGDYHYLRLNAESSGNLLNLGSRMFNNERDSLGMYYFLGTPYAQFVMGDVEYKYYHYFSQNRVLVMRVAAGLGLPYANSVALPVEKAFFGGGANDLRGWGLKLLGPGSFVSDLDIERVADISLKANIEYRFSLYKFLRMAAFVDAGNIWLFNEDPDFVGGNFEFNRFYKELAVNVGLGLRLDFDFFVLRLDVGVPIVDPSLPEGNRWMKFKMSNAIWNIAIGYPF